MSARGPASEPAPRPTREAPPWWLALALVAHLALIALAQRRELDPLFNDAAHRLGPASDFRAYASAALHHARGDSMYGQGPGLGYRYHPLSLLAASPLLVALPRELAFALWQLVNELALAALCALLWRTLTPNRARAAFVAGALLSAPYVLEAYMGNATFVAAVLAGFAFEAERRGHTRRFVLAWVLSMMVKPVTLIFAPWWLFRRRYGAVATSLALVLGSAAAYFALSPVDGQRFVAVNLGASAPRGWLVHGGHQGLHGLLASVLARLTGHPPGELGSFTELPTAARVALAALPLLVGAVALAASYRLRREHVGAGFFLGSAAYLLGYKDVWEHSYSLLAVALPMLYQARLVAPRWLALAAVALALPGPFVLYDVALPRGPHDPESHWSLAVAVLHHGWRPAWLLALFVPVCARAARR